MNEKLSQTSSFNEEVKKINESINNLPKEVRDPITKEAEDLKARYSSSTRLKAGDKAPDFRLQNAVGKTVRLYKLLEENRVVLTFYRGTWCPYCNLQLSQYQEVLFKLKSIGSSIVAISPQNPDESLNMKEKNNLSFEVLSDPKNEVAKKFTEIIKKSENFTRTISSLGKAFEEHYFDDSNEVPIPAVFIIDRDGTILFAKSEGGDYRNRTEPVEVLKVLTSN